MVLASMGSWAGSGKPEVRPPGWQVAPDKRACGMVNPRFATDGALLSFRGRS
jgi:hypothetical protein